MLFPPTLEPLKVFSILFKVMSSYCTRKILCTFKQKFSKQIFQLSLDCILFGGSRYNLPTFCERPKIDLIDLTHLGSSDQDIYCFHGKIINCIQALKSRAQLLTQFYRNFQKEILESVRNFFGFVYGNLIFWPIHLKKKYK